MTASRLLRTSLLGLSAAFLVHGASAQKPGSAKEPPPPGQWTKLNESIDTGYSRAGAKISATLQSEATVPAHDATPAVTLPKGTKLAGTVVRVVQQGKEHPHSGLILLFDTAELKDHKTVPVHAVIRSLEPSASDQIEKIDVGSGDVTDANSRVNKEMGAMFDPNESVNGDTATKTGNERYTSKIMGVLLFAAAKGEASGIVVAARPGPLHLEKWTRLNIVLGPPSEAPAVP